MTNEELAVGRSVLICSKSKARTKQKSGKLNKKQPQKKEIVNEEDDVNVIVRDILYDICEMIETKDANIVIRESPACVELRKKRQDPRSRKEANRKTYVLENDDKFDLQPETYLDENENQLVNAINEFVVNRNHKTKVPDDEKKVKKRSLSSFFRKKDKDKERKTKSKTEIEHETYDDFDPFENFSSNNSLVKSKKYASARDLSEFSSAMISRTPSFVKRTLVGLHTETRSLIRSLSFRDLSKKRDKEKLAEQKKIEWKSSLQRLVETDISVSYNDLSFVNYDEFNTVSYGDDLPKVSVNRSQSLYVRRASPDSFEHQVTLQRGTSVTDRCPTPTNLTEHSGALSLPSLHHLNQDNAEQSLEANTQPRYRRRPQSICSEDGKGRSYVNGSFRSAGSGCAKLKRHNACRQKNRDVLSLQFDPKPVDQDEGTVRSRSLNHLDSLEMRQGAIPSTDPALKDSRSEPDCTKPLLAPPIHVPTEASLVSEMPSSKRHTLSRSQKSSSECFSVNFEVGDESTWDTELFFPAARGISLHDSLGKLCELRNIDLSSCDVWLTDKDMSTNILLPLAHDTANLVGRHIRVTVAKDTGRKLTGSTSSAGHSRKLSGSSRTRTSSFFSSSTEEQSASVVSSSNLSLYEGDSTKKQPKQPRWSVFFSNNKDAKMENLIEQLNNYSKHGIPVHQDHLEASCPALEALYKLEEDWRDILDPSEMSERLQQQQTALWELIKTEVAYIKTLKVVTDLFLACLKSLQTVNILKEIDTDKLFSNITDILTSNLTFWKNSLFPLVRDMRKYKQPPCIENMCEGFSKMRDSFQPYVRYCAEQSRCQHYCRDVIAHNELFTAYLAWCETQKDCNRLRLMDILVQPMQRLTKYGLLLKAILKNTDDDVERETLNSMIKMVDDFVNSVNSSLKQRQDNERLKGIIARIESYDVVESKDDDLEKLLKSYNQLDLNKPMLNCPPERRRHLLLEGDLKLKESNTSKMEVHCFLLTDMLLICKPSARKGGAMMRVIRQPYLVDRLVVTELTRETPSLAIIYKNEFDMAVAAFILQNNDAKKLKSWKDGIIKAQTLYSQAKQMSYMTEESMDTDYSFDYNLENDYHSLQLVPRSPLATSSRASRVSSLAHSHSGSVEMNDQSSVGSVKEPSRAVSVENENRTGSISSDEGVQPLPPDKSPVSQKSSFKYRIFNKTPNTLSVQPFNSNLGQSLPNLVTLGSPNVGTLSLSLNQNTLSVPNAKNGGHLLSPTSRGISYPPPSPTRGNLRRGLAISQSKNPPLLKTRHINSSTTATSCAQIPASIDFDVPVIAGVSPPGELCDSFSRGQHRQAMLKRIYRNDNKRYHTAGVVDDIKRDDNRDVSIHKRLSWNCVSLEHEQPPSGEQT